nr:phospholipase-like protein [Tanacetum cinerariifolium]
MDEHVELWVNYMCHFRPHDADWAMVGGYFVQLLLQDLMTSWMIMSVPTLYSSRLLGFNMDEEPIIEFDNIGYLMDTTLQVYHRTHEEFQNLGVEAKIPEVMMQAKVFDQKGIDHTRYSISFTTL